MRNARGLIGVMAGSMVLLSAASIFAQDWPQWRGANRDGKVTGFTAPQTWPKTLTQKWRTSVGPGDATPALVGDKLYVAARQGDEEVTLCLDAKDGKELWKDKYAAQAVTGAAAKHPGPRSSPAVADGKVVTLGVGGVLSCLDAATGKLVWRKDPFPKTVPMFFAASSPIIVDGMAIAQLGGRAKGGIVAYDLATGDEKWKWDGGGPEYSSPVVMTVDGTKQIVALTDKSLVGVGAADGKLLWQLPFQSAQRAYNAATPIIEGQTVIYMGAGRGTKAAKVEKTADGFAAKELWSNPETAPQFGSAVLQDGLLFGFSNSGNLYCINAQDGKTAWVDTAKHGGAFAAIVNAGSVILALPSTSELIVFKPSAKGYEEVAKIKVADSATYAHPVIAGKNIFVRDQDAMTLLTIE